MMSSAQRQWHYTPCDWAKLEIKTSSSWSYLVSYRRLESLNDAMGRTLERFFRSSRTSLHFFNAILHLQLLLLHHQHQVLMIGTVGPERPHLMLLCIMFLFFLISICCWVRKRPSLLNSYFLFLVFPFYFYFVVLIPWDDDPFFTFRGLKRALDEPSLILSRRNTGDHPYLTHF